MARTASTQAALDRAAGLLVAVGLVDAAVGRDAMLAMCALSAADHLRRAGAQTPSVPGTDAEAAITEALRILSALPKDVFDEDAVADAVDDAQDALAAARA